MDNLTVVNNHQNLRYEVDLGDDKAYLEYRWYKTDLALMHTFVPENYEGKGIAGLLAKTVLEYAKAEGLKIMVYCPFVGSYVKRHREYEALVKNISQ